MRFEAVRDCVMFLFWRRCVLRRRLHVCYSCSLICSRRCIRHWLHLAMVVVIQPCKHISAVAVCIGAGCISNCHLAFHNLRADFLADAALFRPNHPAYLQHSVSVSTRCS